MQGATSERTPGGPPGVMGENGVTSETLMKRILNETNPVTRALLELQFFTTFGVPTYTLLHGQSETIQHHP